MGGVAFRSTTAAGHPPPYTPRMQPEEYHRVKAIYLARLREEYPERQIDSLLEAPEKQSHGDVDIIVSSDEGPIDFLDLATRLGAVGVVRGSRNCSLACVKDGSRRSGITLEYRPVNDHGASAKTALPVITHQEEYAQVDVELVPRELFDWHSFLFAYGEISDIFGRMIRGLGFRMSNVGLSLRLQELDDAKARGYVRVTDSEGFVLLSHDPDKVMEFLGLSCKTYHAGFDTVEEFYTWTGQCRVLSADVFESRENSKQRQKQMKRGRYVYFFEKWLPAYLESNPDAMSMWQSNADGEHSQIEQRRYLQEEALDFFDKREVFVSRRDHMVLHVDNETADHLIKPIIAEHSGRTKENLNEIVRAVRRWTEYSHDEKSLMVVSSPRSDAESQLHHLLAEDRVSLRDTSATSEWIRQHWEELRVLERGKTKRR